ncbi:MAG: hypothetical protein QOH68_2627, partial [Nocardioidaceae bacterium]|nr:hypothetical protein [Nocardioidaceae bacterium]
MPVGRWGTWPPALKTSTRPLATLFARGIRLVDHG